MSTFFGFAKIKYCNYYSKNEKKNTFEFHLCQNAKTNPNLKESKAHFNVQKIRHDFDYSWEKWDSISF